jgi:hypothetical protein
MDNELYCLDISIWAQLNRLISVFLISLCALSSTGVISMIDLHVKQNANAYDDLNEQGDKPQSRKHEMHD